MSLLERIKKTLRIGKPYDCSDPSPDQFLEYLEETPRRNSYQIIATYYRLDPDNRIGDSYNMFCYTYYPDGSVIRTKSLNNKAIHLQAFMTREAAISELKTLKRLKTEITREQFES